VRRRFDIRTAHGGTTHLELRRLADLNNRALWLRPIVADVLIWRVDEVPDACWATPDAAWNALYSGRLTSSDIRTVIARLITARPNDLLVQVDFSFGGLISAICGDLVISRVEP
jgi:hypothetical protein